MTDSTAPFPDERQHEVRRRHRQERLYVLLQTVGWLGFLVLQLVFSRLFLPPEKRDDVFDYTVAVSRIVLLGWLLSHVARLCIHRWGWKRLGSIALLPRAFALALTLSTLWTLVGYGYQFGVLRDPWPPDFPPALLVVVSIINGAILLLGWLCLYFCYHAFDRFNSSEIERLRLQATVKEAELRALKAQVNPHFMFNALNSVRALIDEDPARARQAVTQLANLLRYSLQSGALETVPFEDELQVVNDYLALEQVRHEERLRLRIDVAPEVLRQPLPPMLLQTLVENAVKYGVSTRPQGGEIRICARRAGYRLELRVTNPGTLAHGEETHRAARSTGLGIRNAAERLRLLFGESASLSLRQDGPDLVVAEVTIPLENAFPPGGAARPDARPATHPQPPARATTVL